jgi:hypothetical protein
MIQNCTPKTQKTAENSRNALKNVDLAHRTKLYQKKTKSTKLYRKRLTRCGCSGTRVSMEREEKTIKYIIGEGEEQVIVKYSVEPTEFEIQSYLYTEISFILDKLDNFHNVYPEVTVCIGEIFFRFDLMVFKKELPICGIEVKKNKYKNNNHNKQLSNYFKFKDLTEIPVIYCYGMGQVEDTIKKVKKLLY